jgi:hypothetical protein
MLVTHGSPVGLASTNQTVISTTVTVYDQDGNEIGFMQQINRSDSRPTFKIRHLNAQDAGRIVEQQPGVEDYTLNVTGFGLYNQTDVARNSLLNRLPGSTALKFKVLNDQFIPFAIKETETHPATQATNTTLYLGCYLTNFTKPISIQTVTITESATVVPSWVE